MVIIFMIRRLMLLALLATGLSMLFTKLWIAFSRRESIGQPIREEGNKAHYKKQGTPTMGGVAFIAVFLLLYLLFGQKDRAMVLILLSTVGFGAIGFVDDYAKIRKKESEGLTPRQKLILQVGLAALLVILFFFFHPDAGIQRIPLVNWMLNLSVFWAPILVFILVGTVNAVNLTDGLDGLCAGVSLPVFLALFVETKIFYRDFLSAGTAAWIFLFVLLGYLVFNAYPASVMMGDTGSMAIGGAICAIFLSQNISLYLVIFGGVYMMETLSVIIQVTYFKHTGGKRIFLMSPIHHHFELKGYPESKITASFCILSTILCLVGLLFL